jgi:hypothetical protein
MKKSRLLLMILVTNLFIGPSIAQFDLKLPQIVPPSPTAAAMARYGEIPVSTYTGVADISIPLYEISNKEIKVPVSLSYHSGGIKVEEDASWVGLGWSLINGGSITRMMRGLDDVPTSSANGYPDTYMPNGINGTADTYVQPGDPAVIAYDKNFLNDVINGREDPEPDIFVFSFSGRSGKFVLRKRANPSMPLEAVLLSSSDLQITGSYSSETQNYQWVITDEKGIKYYFKTTETTVSRSATAEDEMTADMQAPDGTPSEVVTSWYLDKIVSPTGAEINYSYYSSATVGHGTKKILNRSQIKKHVTRLTGTNGCTVPMNQFYYISTYTEVQDVYLSKISFPNGKVDFICSDREDIEPAGGGTLTYAKKLDEMSVWAGSEGNYTLLNKFIFGYSYFGENSYASKRLKLLSVTESDGTSGKPPYLFTYNGIPLPNKDSKAIDHWGYYNGANNSQVNETTYGDYITNGTLVPPTTVYLPQSSEHRTYKGANREPNGSLAQAGMLTSITYPTGGSSSFEYELNNYYDPRDEVVEEGHYMFATKFGPQTPVPNLYPDTFTIEFLKATDVIVTTSVTCYGGNTCLVGPGLEYEYDVAHIQSVDGTPYYDKWIGYLLTSQNQADGTLQEMTLELPAGKYKFTVFADENYYSRLFADWTEKVTVRKYDHDGAGLRVRKVTINDGFLHANDQITEYIYTANRAVPNASTGILMTRPIYEYTETYRKLCSENAVILQSEAVVRTSSPLIPISTAAQGNPIGYDEVTVINGTKGKTVYEYYNQPDAGTIAYPNYPTIPYSGNGLLKNETTYKRNDNGSYQKIKAVTKTYATGDRQTLIRGMLMPSADRVNIVYDELGTIPMYNNVRFYNVVAAWDHPVLETVETFSASDESLAASHTTTYQYDNMNWHQLTGTLVTDSKNRVEATSYKYAFDFAGDPVYDKMVTNNQVGNIVEATRAVAGVHQQSTKTNYNFWYNNAWGNNTANSFIVPQTVATKILDRVLYDTRLRYHSYDNNGNITCAAKENCAKLTYLWAYNNMYPVAAATNAGPDQIAYSSFETSDAGGWTINPGGSYSNTAIVTGRRSFSGSIGKAVPAGDYIITAWAAGNISVNANPGGTPLKISKQNGNWKLYQWKLTNVTNVLVTADNMDEVRLYPATAQMTTKTYDPLIGVTSECDTRNNITYYGYDSFKRLSVVRDQNGNIIKTIKYHYKQ